MIDHPLALRLAAEKACRSRVWTYTVGIVNSIRMVKPEKRMDQEGAASGCAGRWGKHHFIVTAQHVVHKEAKPSDVRLFWRPYGEDQYVADKDLKPLDFGDAIAIKDASAAIHRCVWEDLAVITIDPSEAGQYSEFIDLGMEWIDPSANEWVSVCGFPHDKRVRVDDRMVTEDRREITLALRPEIFSGQVLSGPNFATNDFVPDRHYLVPYVHKTSSYPGRFSGAAAWWESDKPQQVWRPNFKFAGICTHCYKDINPIPERIVKASAVRKFLEEVFGPTVDGVI